MRTTTFPSWLLTTVALIPYLRTSAMQESCQVLGIPASRGSATYCVRDVRTGVLFFTRDVEEVFDSWKRSCAALNSAHYFLSGHGRQCMPHNDQAGFAAAVFDWDFNPFVLPTNWNFRKRWHKSVYGPVKIWHDVDDVPIGLEHFNASQSEADDLILYGELVA